MDWIEQIFHVSPDGGNGALEALYFGVAFVAVVGVVFRRRIGQWARGRRRQP